MDDCNRVAASGEALLFHIRCVH